MDSHDDCPLPAKPLEAIDPSRFSLLSLMTLAVAAQGAPMTYEEIRKRLQTIGVTRPVGSLKKAWHGLLPLKKTADGRLFLVDEGEFGE